MGMRGWRGEKGKEGSKREADIQSFGPTDNPT
jgi:hypothetical protein